MPDRGRWRFGSRSMTRVLLIHPPLDRLRGLHSARFPIHAGYLAAALQADGFEASILNAELPQPGERLGRARERERIAAWGRYVEALANRQHRAWVQLAQALREIKPGIVVMWVETPRFGPAMAAARIVRDVLPHARIVWCGPHPTAVPAVALDANVDYVVRGEAEKTVVALARALRAHQPVGKVAGLAFSLDGRVAKTPPRDLVREVDTFMPPGRHLDLAERLYPPEQLTALYSARGLPLRCRFSPDHIAWGRGLRARSAYALTEELRRLLRRYPVDTFRFLDACFTLSHQRTIKLCEAIANERLGALWAATTRANLVNEQLIDALARAGCCALDLQVATGSPRMMKHLGLGETIDQVHHVGELCRAVGISWAARFYAGFPSETEQDLLHTRDAMAQLDADALSIQLITPAPGTQLFADALKAGVVPRPVDWSVFSQYNAELNLVKNVPRDVFDDLVAEMIALAEHHNRSWSKRWSRSRPRRAFYRRYPLRLLRRSLRRLRGSRGVPHGAHHD